jgi:hypothetical protein
MDRHPAAQSSYQFASIASYRSNDYLPRVDNPVGYRCGQGRCCGNLLMPMLP